MNREGMLLVMFDLPQSSSSQQREYRKFVKAMKKSGFLLLQESVYVKHLHNISSAPKEKMKLKAVVPSGGQVIAVPITVAQFRSFTVLNGNDIPFDKYCSSILFL